MKCEFEQIEMMADRRSRVPSMVLIYPLDHHQLQSGLVGQKWMLKLCCMYPLGPHTLEGGDDVKEGETRPEIGWYRLEDLGVHTATVLRWVKSHEKILKVVSPRLAAALEWVHQGAVTEFIGEHAKSISGLSVPESTLPSGAGEQLPISSGLITLAGLRESDYRLLEGQGLVFLEEVFKQHQPCGNLHLFIDEEGRMLWLCGRHRDEMRAAREAVGAARREELLRRYLQHVDSRVTKVRILGDQELHDLTSVFVELTVFGDRERPSSRTQAEYWEVMDAELRGRRNPLLVGRALEDQRQAVGRKVRPEEMMKAGTRALIAGAPGTGKSTLLKYLALKVLRGEDYIPIFLELNTIEVADFAAAKGSLAELVFAKGVAEVVCETGSDRAGMRDEFYNKLKAGRIAVFLDGLDEVSGTEFFVGLRLAVKAFLRRGEYRSNILIISTRPYALLDQFVSEEAQEMEIAPFNPEQIERFVGHYYGGDPLAAEFLGELRRRPDLRELASVPALLGLLLILFRSNEGRVPEDRLELYREVVQKLASEWDMEKPARREFQTTDAKRIDFLAHLAFARLFDASGRQLSRRFIFTGMEIFREAERYCRLKGIPSQADILAKEAKATALLRQIGADTYAFAHLTLQEYLAATVLGYHEDREKIFCRAYLDETLSEMEVLPMFLGLAEHEAGLHESLNEMPESLDYKKLRLRARSLTYGRPPEWLLSELGDSLDELVRAEGEVEYGYFELIIRAFSMASGAAGETIAGRVAKRLAPNEHDYVRTYAVRAAGIIGNDAAVNALRLALKDADASVRVEAAKLLGPKDEKAALEVLTQEIRSGDDEVKDEVIYALWNLGGATAAEVLEEAAKKYPAVRKRALEALASTREAAAVPTLASYLNDPDDWVRSTVVEALGELGGGSVVPYLIKAVDDKEINVAEKAVTLLGQIGGEDVRRFLADLLENRSGKLIGAVAEALGQAGVVESIPKLAQLLNDYKDDESDKDFRRLLFGGWIKGYVRARIAGALCQLGDERGRAALVEAITERYSEERKEAAKALARCRPDEAKTLLTDVIGNIQTTDNLAKYDLAAIADILYHLDACDDLRVIDAMINLLSSSRNSQDSTTTIAMNVLGHVGGRAAVDALTKAAEHSNPIRQLSALTALGNIADENTVTGLLKGLTTGVNAVSQYAARGLSRVAQSALCEGLKRNTNSDYPVVRRKVARCLFYYSHDQQSVELMTKIAANDPSDKIRSVARLALDRLQHMQKFIS